MPVFEYEIRPDPDSPVEFGELEAVDEKDARRLLRVRYCRPHLPSDTRIEDQAARQQREQRVRSAKLRRLLRALSAHHEWLDDPSTGERADLRGLDLSQVSLRGARLAQANLSHADLSGADLSSADLSAANLTGAVLERASLREACLADADLSDADLRSSDLTGADLSRADVWRANFIGCTIEPETLHDVLRCQTADAAVPAAAAQVQEVAPVT